MSPVIQTTPPHRNQLPELPTPSSLVPSQLLSLWDVQPVPRPLCSGIPNWDPSALSAFAPLPGDEVRDIEVSVWGPGFKVGSNTFNG